MYEYKDRSQEIGKNSIVTNVVVNSILLLVFLIIYEEHATGISIHEWGALALVSIIVVHILLHWQWIVACGKRFFQNIKGCIRLNYIINIMLFVAFTAVIFSGLMISEVVMPAIGLRLPQSGFWRWLHGFAADVSLGLVVFHVGLHWKWVINAVKRTVVAPASSKAKLHQKPALSVDAE